MIDIFNQLFVLWNFISNIFGHNAFITIVIFIIILIISIFGKKIINFIKNMIKNNKIENVTLLYRTFWGITNHVLNVQMRDEFRRSFKENGFYNLEGAEFTQYVKNQSKILFSMFKNSIINLYPDNRKEIKVSMDNIIDYIEKNNQSFDDLVYEIYDTVKKIKLEKDKELELIDIEFEKDIDDFIINKGDVDCKNCFKILFGKREIAENKRYKIKTLKAQMNFVEQKLIEIHSHYISFYSEQLNKKNVNK